LNKYDADILRAMTRSIYLGLVMNLIAPVVLLGAAMFFLGDGSSFGEGIAFGPEKDTEIMFYALLGVSVMDFAIVFGFRRLMPDFLFDLRPDSFSGRFDATVWKMSLLIYGFNLSYSVWGFVMIALGASIDTAVPFLAMTMIGYQLFRPRKKFLLRVIERIEKDKY